MTDGDILYDILLYAELYIAFFTTVILVLCIIGIMKINNIKKELEKVEGIKDVISHNTKAMEKFERTMDKLTSRIIEDGTKIKTMLEKGQKD